MTKKEMRDLLVKFLEIKNMGWIKSLRKGTTGIGYTFETLLGKPEESFPIPDFESIEIKVKRRYSKGTITLFNAVPDNEVFAARRVYETYGVQNKNKNYYKTFMLNVNSQEMTKYGKHNFKLEVDYIGKVIKLNIYNGNKIQDNTSWSFDLINEKINNKIKNLAIIKADVKQEYKENYYHYYHITFYEIKGLNTFLELVANGTISITFKISVYSTGNKTGEMDNHGIGFIINEKNISRLYNIKDFEKKQLIHAFSRFFKN